MERSPPPEDLEHSRSASRLWFAASWLPGIVLLFGGARGKVGAAVMASVLVAACGSGPDASRGPTADRWSTGGDPLVSIGEVDGAEEYILSGVTSVRLLDDDRIAVADRSSGTIRLYSLDGRFLDQMGRIGQGPGEFRSIMAMALHPPDTLLVYDGEAQRLTTYQATGDLLHTVDFHASDGWPEVYFGSTSGGLHAAAWIAQGSRDRDVITPDLMRAGLFDGTGELIRVIYAGPGMRRLFGPPLPFSGHLVGRSLGDTLFVTDGHGGRVQAIGAGGDTIRTLSIDLPAWNPEDAWRALESELDSATAARFPDVRDHPGVDSIPTISDLVADDLGRLWVKQYDPTTDSHWLSRPRTGGQWLVVTTGGQVVADFDAPEGLRVMDVRGGRVAGVVRDDLGVERVQVFDVVGWSGS